MLYKTSFNSSLKSIPIHLLIEDVNIQLKKKKKIPKYLIEEKKITSLLFCMYIWIYCPERKERRKAGMEKASLTSLLYIVVVSIRTLQKRFQVT